jgi:hypothetical protein
MRRGSHHDPAAQCLCSRPKEPGRRTCGRAFCEQQLDRILDRREVMAARAVERSEEGRYGEAE